MILGRVHSHSNELGAMEGAARRRTRHPTRMRSSFKRNCVETNVVLQHNNNSKKHDFGNHPHADYPCDIPHVYLDKAGSWGDMGVWWGYMSGSLLQIV